MSEKRVRTGCATCRRRRIKCDEAKPICSRCRNANFQCEGYAAPRRLSNASAASISMFSKRSTSSPSSKSSSASPPDTSSFPEISLRHKDWRREQLPLYHHFVTTTVVRLFRSDHVAFWRDEVVQMSHGMDLVYEALLAIGAMHRSSLIACQAGNGPQAVRFKLLGFRAYGKVVQLLPSHLASNTLPDIFASLVVLMLLAYFECFLENPKAAFRHLWAAIQLFRSSEVRFTEHEMSHVIPIFDAMLRLDHLAQTHVPYANSSFLRCSDQAFMESPFWNRLDPVYSGSNQADYVAAERYRLIQLISAHNRLTRIVWSCWTPAKEWPTREELMGFYSEMTLWKATSPATFANTCSDDGRDPSIRSQSFSFANHNHGQLKDALKTDFSPTSSLSDPQPYYFATNEAALNAAMYNDYLSCACAMISTTDDDPIASELEAFSLVYENLRIAAGLIERHRNWASSGSPYKPCDAVSMGIITFLSHGARRCFSSAWQKWTINALREIGREGLSNGHSVANMVEILRILEANAHYGDDTMDDAYLGPVGKRLMPLLMPHGEGDQYMAYYLRHGLSQFNGDDSSINVVANAIWRQEADGTMHSLQLNEYESGAAPDTQQQKPQAMELFNSWRQEVEKGWHGYLSSDIQDGFLKRE